MSLCEVTPDLQPGDTGPRPPQRLSGCASGVEPEGANFVQIWCIRMQGSFRELRHRVIEGRKAFWTARSSPGRDEAGAARADVERTICQPLVWDLALEQNGAVHLHVCLVSLLQGNTRLGRHHSV